MLEVLDRAHRAHQNTGSLALLGSVSGWFLPDDLRSNFFRRPSTQATFLNTQAHTPEHRAALVDQILDHFIDHRHNLPRDVVEHLCMWVQASGAI